MARFALPGTETEVLTGLITGGVDTHLSLPTSLRHLILGRCSAAGSRTPGRQVAVPSTGGVPPEVRP